MKIFYDKGMHNSGFEKIQNKNLFFLLKNILYYLINFSGLKSNLNNQLLEFERGNILLASFPIVIATNQYSTGNQEYIMRIN